ncbi:hypothetical protein LXL04_033098 [Taraxacum kok-saghyz]
MNWFLQTEDPRISTGIQYQSSKSYMDFLEELTYEHVNFIFSDAIYPQESANSTINTYAYKFGHSEAGTFSYYDYCDDYPIYNQTMGNNEYIRQLDVNQRTTSEHRQQNEQLSSSFRANPPECLEINHDGGESLHVWEDNVDLDNMTYEELIELGEIVGSQSRGLSQEAISLLPISKFKRGFFWRNFWKKKSRDERCVICQMEYKRGDRQITLPCKHAYHAACGNRWLTINKACPVCYKDVHVNVCPSKREERFR